MTQPAVIQGDYCDIKFIKSRKVAVICVEIPIEAAGAFVDAFGTPMPDKNVPVALARLESPLNVEHEKPKGGKLAQQAGIMCGEAAFWRYLEVRGYLCENAEQAATALRAICDVDSRADLDHHMEPARLFYDLRASYNAWASQ